MHQVLVMGGLGESELLKKAAPSLAKGKGARAGPKHGGRAGFSLGCESV